MPTNVLWISPFLLWCYDLFLKFIIPVYLCQVLMQYSYMTNRPTALFPRQLPNVLCHSFITVMCLNFSWSPVVTISLALIVSSAAFFPQNSDYFLKQHQPISLYNWDVLCLLCDKDWLCREHFDELWLPEVNGSNFSTYK